MSLMKERIAGNVQFQYYRDKELWYKTQDGFLFQVHIDDATGATFKNEDKGILFMRWIRKYMNDLDGQAAL
jgi:inactivated superfamily I helicase